MATKFEQIRAAAEAQRIAKNAKSRERYAENRDKIRAQQKDYYQRNPEKLKENASRYSKSHTGRTAQLLKAAKTRAKEKNLEFSLTTEWLKPKLEAGVCEVTEIEFSAKSYSPFASSLDRVKPDLGYTPENTKVVIKAYNYAKGCGTHEDVLTMAEALCKRK